MNALDEFRRHLRQPGIGGEVLALDIARIRQPALDVAQQLAAIDRLADYVERRLDPAAYGIDAARQFLAIITGDLAFRGDLADYYDPRNSMLDEVLKRRTGLPIMLCLVCIAVGRRIGLQVEGLGFPSHFVARFSDGEHNWLLDPYHNVAVDMDQAETYLSGMLSRPIRLAPYIFAPVTALEIAARILNNLRAAYVTHPHADKLLQVLAFQSVLDPGQAQIWRERAVLNYHLHAWEEAAHDLRRYFYLLGALPYLFPEEARTVYDDLPDLASDDRNLLVMHRRIAEALNRIN